MTEPQTVCVLGGSGFLGSHVCDELSRLGHRVRVFDSRPSPWAPPGQSMIIGDVRRAQDVDAAIAGADVVYNFAAFADLDAARTRPIDTVEINILGNVLALDACVRHKVARYVYASTVYVHSREGGFYRCSKQASEHYVEEYQRAYGLDFTVLRYGSLYGPRSDERNGLYRIVQRALQDGRVSYEGSAEAMREYIHVEDAARASVAALADEFKNQHVVLTGQEPMRVVDLLKMLAEILGLPQEVVFISSDQPGHYVRTPYHHNPRLGRKFVPPMHVDLGQGLLELIEEVQKAPAAATREQ